MNNINVSIIIVNYNTKKLTIDCIHSILNFTENLSYEIIVVDNASQDDSCKEIRAIFPNITIIESDINLGFGRANNLGFKYAKGKYLLFLNSDCLLIENTIKKMFDYFESHKNNNLGAIGCILLDKDHNLNTSYQRFPTFKNIFKSLVITRLNSLIKTNLKLKESANYILEKNCEVDFITGADLFIPSKTFSLLNGFDPIFFMYYEETDLQKRMSDISLKRIILEDTFIIHLEGGSTKKNLKTITLFVDSQYKYIKKHSFIIKYIFYYLFITPLLIPSVLRKSASKEDKRKYIRVLAKHLNPLK